MLKGNLPTKISIKFYSNIFTLISLELAILLRLCPCKANVSELKCFCPRSAGKVLVKYNKLLLYYLF